MRTQQKNTIFWSSHFTVFHSLTVKNVEQTHAVSSDHKYARIITLGYAILAFLKNSELTATWPYILSISNLQQRSKMLDSEAAVMLAQPCIFKDMSSLQCSAIAVTLKSVMF